MKKRLIDLRGEELPLLDIVSLGRASPRSFTAAQREQIARTTGRVPEVMVKVSGGARTLGGVEQHLAYIGRDGELAVESDTGERLQEEHFGRSLVLDWDLDLEAHERQSERWAPSRRSRFLMCIPGRPLSAYLTDRCIDMPRPRKLRLPAAGEVVYPGRLGHEY